MIGKAILRKRLGVALGKEVSEYEFTWFFGYFCDLMHQRSAVRTAKELDEKTVIAFSIFCGYDLRCPIPLPLLVQI